MRTIVVKIYLYLIIFLLTTSSASAEVGIGVDLKELENILSGSLGGKILVPIKTSRLLIEPEFKYLKQEDSLVESTIFDLGIGIYGQSSMADSFNNYYGIRFGIIREEISDPFFVSTVKNSGNFYGMAVGIEYQIANKFSISTQIGLSITDIDNSIKYTKTDAQIILRMYM